MSIKIFDAQTSDGNSSAVQAKSAEDPTNGVLVSVGISGTFNGVTVKLQRRVSDSASWVDITDASYTAAKTVDVSCPQNGQVRAVLSGTASPAPSITVECAGSIFDPT